MCSPTDLKWITRLILKDLKLGLGHESLLNLYHEQSIHLFNTTSDLKQVFIGTYGSKGVFQIFFPVKPMLAGKLNLQNLVE